MFLSTRTPKCSTAELLFSWLCPHSYCHTRLLLPRCSTLLCFVNSMRLLWAPLQVPLYLVYPRLLQSCTNCKASQGALSSIVHFSKGVKQELTHHSWRNTEGPYQERLRTKAADHLGLSYILHQIPWPTQQKSYILLRCLAIMIYSVSSTHLHPSTTKWNTGSQFGRATFISNFSQPATGLWATSHIHSGAFDLQVVTSSWEARCKVWAFYHCI